MPSFIDRTGEKHNRLLIVEDRIIKGKQTYCRCLCDCGNEKTINKAFVVNGHTKSCGCYAVEKAVLDSTTHGLCTHELYRVWVGMKDRCSRTNSKYYKYYGGRGIYVCRRWLRSFEKFLKDVGERPSKNHSLDRIDNNGSYGPWNCRWATKKEQAQNTKRNIILYFKGASFCLSEWARRLNIKVGTLRARIFDYGWSVERTLTEPVNIKFRRKNNGGSNN